MLPSHFKADGENRAQAVRLPTKAGGYPVRLCNLSPRRSHIQTPFFKPQAGGDSAPPAVLIN